VKTNNFRGFKTETT